MHLRCGKKSASNRNNQEWDRLKFVPLLWQANVFPDHLKSPSVINDDERIPAGFIFFANTTLNSRIAPPALPSHSYREYGASESFIVFPTMTRNPSRSSSL